MDFGGRIVLLAQNFTIVRIRVGVYDHQYAGELQGIFTPRDEKEWSYLKIYSTREYNMNDRDQLKELCILLLGFGLTLQEERDRNEYDGQEI